jgi:mitochondrial fission protein ELM1
MKDIVCWVLKDRVVGHAKQAEALARNLGCFIIEKKLEYNVLARLPNFLLRATTAHLTKESCAKLLLDSPPNLVISAGRLPSLVALYLKSRFGSKIVQILNPRFGLNHFDKIVLPHHDSYAGDSHKVIRTLGALAYIDNSNNKQETYSKIFPRSKGSIALLLGGSTKNYTFTIKDAKLLITILLKISNNQGLVNAPHFFISFSRRTPQKVKDEFYRNFREPHLIYDPIDERLQNPYTALLACASSIITTADSVSMCSEAASSGKPLYIFLPNKFKNKKHLAFLYRLFDAGIARELDQSVDYLEEYSYEPLNEAGRVSDIIKATIIKDL